MLHSCVTPTLIISTPRQASQSTCGNVTLDRVLSGVLFPGLRDACFQSGWFSLAAGRLVCPQRLAVDLAGWSRLQPHAAEFSE